MGKQMAETLSLLTRQGNKMDELDTSWFKPENYSSLPKLSLEEWYEQLIFRYNLSEIESGQLTPTMPTDITLDVVKIIKECGVLPLGILKELSYVAHGGKFPKEGLIRPSELFPDSTQTVSSLPASVLKLAVDYGQLAAFDEAYEANTKGKPTGEQVKIINGSFDDLRRRAGLDVSMAHVTVDLHATDTQIRSDFKKWLSAHRLSHENQTPKNDVKKETMGYWVEYGVLQYIDLKLIANVEQKEITNKRLGDLIFPDEFDIDTTKRISDTTKKYAEKVLSNSFLNAFEQQVLDLDDIEY